MTTLLQKAYKKIVSYNYFYDFREICDKIDNKQIYSPICSIWFLVSQKKNSSSNPLGEIFRVDHLI